VREGENLKSRNAENLKMARIDKTKPPGFYYVGFVTQASLDSMPTDEMRERYPLNTPLSNTLPKRSKKEAQTEAEAHHLRDITVIKN
jgi:hypothetical protein